MMSPLQMIANLATRQLGQIFPGFFGTAKHNHYADFGFPQEVTFELAYAAYCRNGIARAAVDKTVGKTWQDTPFVQDHQRDDGSDAKETKLEAGIRERFADLRVWQHLQEADRRAMVGAYSGVILRLADSKPFRAPVDRVNGGLDGLVEVIPAWEGQLTVSSWNTDESSPDYGQPLMFQFNEASVGDKKQARNFEIHPDRVVIWSRDGTLNGRSALEPGYNDLLTIEKIVGAGGEGFWKNAKSSPVLEVDKEAKPAEMAKAMGIKPEELVDRMNEQVEDWQKGFDKLLMLQGMQAKALQVTLPSPEHFFLVALQSFAASLLIPLKILVGSQTGERASTEDAEEWAHTNMARRTGHVIPNVLALLRRLERFGILPKKDWNLEWASLVEPSPSETLERADKMADVNVKLKDSGEWAFTPEEIRYAAGFEPLTASDRYRDDILDNEQDEELASNADKAA